MKMQAIVTTINNFIEVQQMRLKLLKQNLIKSLLRMSSDLSQALGGVFEKKDAFGAVSTQPFLPKSLTKKKQMKTRTGII